MEERALYKCKNNRSLGKIFLKKMKRKRYMYKKLKKKKLNQ